MSATPLAKVTDKPHASKTVVGLSPMQEEFCQAVTTYDDRGMLPTLKAAWLKVYGEDSHYRDATTMMKEPAVKARVQELLAVSMEDHRFRSVNQGIAVVANRIDRRNRDWLAMENIKDSRRKSTAVLEARIEELNAKIEESDDEDEKMSLAVRVDALVSQLPGEAGMDTGLMVQQVKVVTTEDGQQVIRVPVVDKNLLDSQLALEDAVAKDLGQHRQVIESTVHVKAYANFDPDDV